MDFCIYMEDYEKEFLMCEEANLEIDKAELSLRTHNRMSELQNRASILRSYSENDSYFYEETNSTVEKKKNLIKRVWDRLIEWITRVITNVRNVFSNKNTKSNDPVYVPQELPIATTHARNVVNSIKTFVSKRCTAKAMGVIIISVVGLLMLTKALLKRNILATDLLRKKNAIKNNISDLQEKKSTIDQAIKEYDLGAPKGNSTDIDAYIKSVGYLRMDAHMVKSITEELTWRMDDLKKCAQTATSKELNEKTKTIECLQNNRNFYADNVKNKIYIDVDKLSPDIRNHMISRRDDIDKELGSERIKLSAAQKEILDEFGVTDIDPDDLFMLLKSLLRVSIRALSDILLKLSKCI